MKRFYVIETLEVLRAVSDPLRIQILFLLSEEYTGKQLADILNLSPSKVHYHLRELEHHGLIQVVRTEEKNGIVQKFFQDVALDYVVSETLLPSLQGNTMLIQEIILNSLRMGIRRVYHAPDESFLLPTKEDEIAPPLVYHSYEIKCTRQEIHQWLKKYRVLMQELLDIDKKHEQTTIDADEEENRELFYLVNAGFLVDRPLFNVDDVEDGDSDYELNNDWIVRKRQNRSDNHNEL